jgi:hypothetical protein
LGKAGLDGKTPKTGAVVSLPRKRAASGDSGELEAKANLKGNKDNKKHKKNKRSKNE